MLPDFRSHSKSRLFATQPLLNHLKFRQGQISDHHCIWVFDFLIIIASIFRCSYFSASEKRETMEKKLRVKLEEELKELRAAAQAQKDGNTEPRNYPSGADSLDELRRKFGEAEEKVNLNR